MSHSYEIIEFQPELKDRLLQLARHIWGPDEARNARHFDWKYSDNPVWEGAVPLIYLALQQDRVVAMRGVYCLKLEAGIPGLTFKVYCTGDTVVHPLHRGRGLLQLLTAPLLAKLSEMESHYILGVSNVPATYFHFLKLGYKEIGAYQPLQLRGPTQTSEWIAKRIAEKFQSSPILQRLFSRQLSQFLTSYTAQKLEPFARIDEYGRCSNNSIFADSKPRPRQMAALIQRLETDGRIRQVRDRQYFKWRFRNPLSRFRFIYLGDQHDLEGYLILQVGRYHGRRTVSIVDWEGSSLNIRKSLLKAAIEWVKTPSLVTWAATRSAQDLSLLMESRFLPQEHAGREPDYQPGLLIRSIPSPKTQTGWCIADRNLLDIVDWDLRMTISDSY